MTLVACACGVAMYSQGGLPGTSATLGGLAVFIVLYVLHRLFMRANDTGEAASFDQRPQDARRRMPETQREPLRETQKEILREVPRDPMRDSQIPGAAAAVTGPAFGGARLGESRPFAPSLATPAGPSPRPDGLGPGLRALIKEGTRTSAGAPAAIAPVRPSAPAAPQASQSPLRPFAYTTPAPKEEPARPAPAHEPPVSAASPDIVPDYWSFRPAAPRLEMPGAAPSTASGAPAPEPSRAFPLRGPQTKPAAEAGEGPLAAQSTPASPGAPRDSDVEMVQQAIKRLLEQVNSSDVLKAAAQESAASAAAAHPPAAARMTAPIAPAPVVPEQAVEDSLDALRLAADSMRAASRGSAPQPARTEATHRGAAPGRAATPAATPSARGPVLLGPVRDRAASIADAITAGRIDVLLEPILGLDDQRARHYEVSLRLRDAAGGLIEGPDRDTHLRGTGLMPLFDCARITRTATVAQRLESRGKAGSVFSDFNGESLTDDRFLGELAETLHQRASFATQLVLTFAQSEVRTFSGGEWDTIADMRALGFRFGLSGVTDLDMDFEALAEAGFVFVKLDADVFLNGLPIGGGRIPPTDLCRHLARLGLTLIVGRIDSEEQRARIFGFGVLLGQGHLFGGPRPVKASALTGASHAAA